MSDDASESLAAARRVDARCDEFELALTTSKSPQIESFLTDMSASERPTLLLELLGLELDFRVARGEQPKVGDYVKRFPELSAEQLAAIVEVSRGRAGVSASVGPAVPNADQPTILSPTDAVNAANESAPGTLKRVRYFGDYELLREIARGGMGVVYEARQRSLNRPVALKMILSGQLASAEEVARFRREAKAAAQLEHPGIVPIFEIGTDGDQHYFTMGYVSGPSLSARLLERPLEPREAATLILDVALAVQYAHERGVVHRDLKPSNILLAPRSDGSHVRQNVGQPDVRPHSGECGYTPRITDFGLAKVSHADHSLTETGQILGTPSYMPPEQASGLTHLIGPGADIYSLGAVLYACLTGRPPFQAASVLDTVRQVLERDPVSLRDLNAAIPQDLETICLKCLEKSIPRRYPTAQAVADELQRYLEGRPIDARPVSRRERAWRWCRRNPVVAGLSAAVAMSLLLGIAVSSYFAWQENKRAISESDARRDEELQRRKADQQTVIAKKLGADNLKLAEDEKAARQKADLNAEAAKQQTKLAKRHLYAAHMNLVQASWEANRVGEAVRLLNLYRPVADQPADKNADTDDLRSFEWYYWDRCCHSDRFTLKAPPSVKSVAFSPDGKRLVSGSLGVAAVKVWDVATGQELLSLKGHKGNLNPSFQIPDKKLQALIEAAQKESDETVINCVTYSPDGKRLASASVDGTVKLWDSTTGAEQLTLKGHAYQVQSVAFSSNGQRLVSTASEILNPNLPWEIKVWDATTGQELRSQQGTNEIVLQAVFSPDGQRIASTSSEKTANVKVWDAETGEELLTLRGQVGGASCVTFSPDGQRLAFANSETIKVWHSTTGQEQLNLRGHSDSVRSVAFSPDGQRLVSASSDQTIKVWKGDTGQELLTLKGHSELVLSVAISPDGTRIASASSDGTIKLWDATTTQESRTLNGVAGWIFVFRGDGQQLAVAGNATIKICDPVTGVVKRTTQVLPRERQNGVGVMIHGVALTADGQHLAAACSDKSVRLFDVATGVETQVLQGHINTINGVAFHPHGKLLASAGDSTIKLWNARNGQVSLTLKGHTGAVYDVVFSADGNWLASASADKTVRLWDVASGQRKLTLKGHTGIVRAIALSPDGKRLASASYDRTVKVWDITSGQETLTLKGHTSAVTHVAFSPDGKRLASSADKTVKLWDSITGQELLTFKGNSLGTFSPDGTRLVLTGLSQSGGLVHIATNIRDATPRSDALVKLDPVERTAPTNVAAEKRTLVREKQLEGDQYRDQKRYAPAIACYREAIDLDPNNGTILNRLAWLMVVRPTKDPPTDEALQFAQRASLRQPTNAYYRNTLGAAQCRVGQFTEALRNLNEVDKNAPPDFSWRTHNMFFQAICQLKLGDRTMAQVAYDKALELLKPPEGDTGVWFEEARLLKNEVEELLRASAADQKK